MNETLKIKLLNAEYEKALKFSKSHYENFPVISLFLPKALRMHVAVIYKFARIADDLVDEGNDSHEKKLNNLNQYRSFLSLALKDNYESNYWMALKSTIDEFNLSNKYFYALLEAFEQDITINRFKEFSDILKYCRNSANPVGRIILELFNIKDESICLLSDKICTALQLTNFYQDVKVDLLKNRIYIPLVELDKFDVDEKQLIDKKFDDNFKNLLEYQIQRCQISFNEGKNLVDYLPKGLKKQIKLTILGGEEILKKIQKNGYDVLNNRPKLKKYDYLYLLFKAFIK